MKKNNKKIYLKTFFNKILKRKKLIFNFKNKTKTKN